MQEENESGRPHQSGTSDRTGQMDGVRISAVLPRAAKSACRREKSYKLCEMTLHAKDSLGYGEKEKNVSVGSTQDGGGVSRPPEPD